MSDLSDPSGQTPVAAGEAGLGPAATPSARVKLRINPVLLGLYLVPLVFLVGRAVWQGRAAGGATLLPMFSAVVLALLVTFLLTWGVFRVLGRSNRAANIAFAVMALLQAAVLVLPDLSWPQQSSGEQSDREIVEALAKQQGARSTVDRVEALVVKLNDIALRVAGANRTCCEKLSGLLTDYARMTRAYHDAAEEFRAAGGKNLRTFNTYDELTQRTALLNRVADANKQLIAFSEGRMSGFEAELEGAGVVHDSAQKIFQAFRKGLNSESVVTMRKALLEEQELSIRFLKVLQDQWGHWSVGADGKTLVLAKDVAPDAARECKELIKQRNEAKQRIAKLLAAARQESGKRPAAESSPSRDASEPSQPSDDE